MEDFIYISNYYNLPGELYTYDDSTVFYKSHISSVWYGSAVPISYYADIHNIDMSFLVNRIFRSLTRSSYKSVT